MRGQDNLHFSLEQEQVQGMQCISFRNESLTLIQRNENFRCFSLPGVPPVHVPVPMKNARYLVPAKFPLLFTAQPLEQMKNKF